MEELKEIDDITPESLAEAMQSHVKGDERNGIGKHLLAQVQNWLFAAGYEEICLLANPDPDIRAYGFYRTFGWQATGKMVGENEIMVMLRSDH